MIATHAELIHHRCQGVGFLAKAMTAAVAFSTIATFWQVT
jgi:hypothetical protein